MLGRGEGMIYQVHQSVLFSCWADVSIVHSKYELRTPLTVVLNLIILLFIKIICNWQQPNLGFIKYDVHFTCLVYYLFFLDRQFRGDAAILVFLKTMPSYNPTSLTPSLFTEVPVLSQESKRSCICVIVISNLSISTIFLLNVWNFSDSVIFVYHFIIGCEIFL
jgi:hypothetical protein